MLSIRAEEPIAEPLPAPEEFEFVVGRRQVASLLFVATVIVAIFSAVSYLAGKAVSPKIPSVVLAASPLAAPPPAQIEVLPATIGPPPEAPLFAEPINGAVYLQMGAVEKGIAAIFAEGLRKHGFRAFAAPGPNEHIFRVLIGPLPTAESYMRAKNTVDEIGLSTFARKYTQ